jgi:hypothetical protein
MPNYRIGTRVLAPDQPDFEALVERAYKASLRPLCLCSGDPGSPMYIASVQGRYILKRMPNSGGQHAMSCVSWEPPEEFSGRADVYGSGVRYEGDTVKLRVNFALSRTGGRSAPESVNRGTTKPSIKADGKQLTLLSLLHYLWDEAGLTRWPGLGGRRNWAFVYRSLLAAAENKRVKDMDLSKVLFLPEPWSKETRDAIAARRRERFTSIASAEGKKAHRLLLLIAELKEIQKTGIGFRVLYFHVPDCGFAMDGGQHERMIRNFGSVMKLQAVHDSRHTIMAATFSVSAEGAPSIEELTLMETNEQWVPFDSVYELNLMEKMIAEGRSFARVLRYNRDSNARMPSFLLTDHGHLPVAMNVQDVDAGAEHQEAQLIHTDYETWTWNPRKQGEIPPLPPPEPDVQASAGHIAEPPLPPSRPAQLLGATGL